jgi:hypothetical protein
MFGGCQIFFCRFQRACRNHRPRELRGFCFYNRKVSASAALEQEKGEATSDENLPPVVEN